MNKVKILLADSHILVAEGMKTLLERYPEFEFSGNVTHGDKLMTAIDKEQPNVLIMDFNQKGYFTFQDLKQVTQNYPELELLAITAQPERNQVNKVLEAKVKGYILKECDEAELVTAIRALSRKEKFYCGKVLDVVLDKGNPEEASCIPPELSKREAEIVSLVGQGLSTEQIAQKLFLSYHTIRTHRRNIMQKLGIKTNAKLILFAISTGLVDLME